MTWDDLRFFLAVAREGSLSRAGTSLGVNHTTVSRRIKQLQEQAGVTLLVRTPEGYSLTAAGEEVKSAALDMEARFQTIDRQVLGRDTRLSGELTVTTIDVLAAMHANDFGRFTARYPNVALSVCCDNQLRSLSRREADVALRGSNSPAEHLVGKRVGRWEYALFAANSLVERIGPGAPPSEYPWVSWLPRLKAKMTEEWMATHAPGARVACYADTSSVMYEMVRAGVGIQFLPVPVARRHADMVQMSETQPGFGMDVWLLTHPDLRRTARVSAFMDHMSERARMIHRCERPVGEV